jgi:hypothetical protein
MVIIVNRKSLSVSSEVKMETGSQFNVIFQLKRSCPRVPLIHKVSSREHLKKKRSSTLRFGRAGGGALTTSYRKKTSMLQNITQRLGMGFYEQ